MAIRLDKHDVLTGGMYWQLDAAKQRAVLVTLGSLGVASYPFQANDLVECAAADVLIKAGYEIQSPAQLAVANHDAKRAGQMTDREATRVPSDDEDVGKLRDRIRRQQDEIEDLTLEVGDLKRASTVTLPLTVPQTKAAYPSVATPIVDPGAAEWACARCQTVNPMATDICECGKIRIGSPSSPSIPHDLGESNHPLNGGMRRNK